MEDESMSASAVPLTEPLSTFPSEDDSASTILLDESIVAASSPTVGKQGFSNSDKRSCYMIVCMHLLFSLPGVAASLSTADMSRLDNVSKAVVELYQRHISVEGPLCILRFKAAVNACWSNFELAREGMQHDAEEYLGRLLDDLGMGDHPNEGNRITWSPTSRVYWPLVGTRACMMCQSESSDVETITILNLPITSSKRHDLSIDSLLLEFFTVPEEVVLRCGQSTQLETCKGGSAMNTVMMLSPPAVLLIHLKRSTRVDSSVSRRSQRTHTIASRRDETVKSHRVVNVPMVLDVAAYCKEPTPLLFELVGVITHKGVEANTGHYVVDLLTCSEPPTWTRYDDAKVRDHEAGCEPVKEWNEGGCIMAYARRQAVPIV
jgi:ubiquitin C-terminal hydrolase